MGTARSVALPNLHPPVSHAESPLPGVQAVLSAEGVLDGESSVVEFQGRETAFIQAHHLPVAEGTRLGVVPWEADYWHWSLTPSLRPDGLPSPTSLFPTCLGCPLFLLLDLKPEEEVEVV